MATTKWIIDPTHSEIGFKVKHMMFTNVSGKFQKFEAEISTDGDSFDNAKIRFSGDIDSLTTGNSERDAHLLSADFFDASQFPKINFASALFKKTTEGSFQLTGDLTVHGITKPLELTAEFSGLMKDPWGNTKIGLVLSGTINRKDFGLTWNAALETGGVLVGDEVRLSAEAQFVKQ